uniref:MADS29 n=1 Tax=Apostasia odorata TaxID=280455 RepID=A0A1L1WL20_9ASPA|nr:MADS29 [Apostasia odorata]
MGRGKIEIRKIENPTYRQVTYSKQRAGIMKKARELTVLCDAEVSLLMFSSTGKFSEYCSPSTDTKRVYDRYQQQSGINLWGGEQYEKMQKTLKDLKETNDDLRREIKQRMGEELDGLGFKELRGLEQNMDEALNFVRSRKFQVINTQTDTYKKKEMNDPFFGYVDDGPTCFDCALALSNGGSHVRISGAAQPTQSLWNGICLSHYLPLA